MEIAKMLSRGLISANIMACLLRDNFDIQFWCKVLAFMRRLIQSGRHGLQIIFRLTTIFRLTRRPYASFISPGV
jgi:hypothetical protein